MGAGRAVQHLSSSSSRGLYTVFAELVYTPKVYGSDSGTPFAEPSDGHGHSGHVWDTRLLRA